MSNERENIDIQIFRKSLTALYEQAFNASLDARALNKMAAYYIALCDWNKMRNLTRILSPEAAARDHFCDSLMPVTYIGEKSSVIDIGSGAGFPIAPIAALRPCCNAYAVEASQKKCEFIKAASIAAGISINVLNARAEDLARTDIRESFEVCVSRAVAPLNMLMELAAPFLKPGGLFLAYKSDSDEASAARHAAKELCLFPEFCVYSPFPGDGRKVFAYRKSERIKQIYPRAFAKIKKSPL